MLLLSEASQAWMLAKADFHALLLAVEGSIDHWVQRGVASDMRLCGMVL
jgi:hypothetical protein